MKLTPQQEEEKIGKFNKNHADFQRLTFLTLTYFRTNPFLSL
jgi:hypothetical protein